MVLSAHAVGSGQVCCCLDNSLSSLQLPTMLNGTAIYTGSALIGQQQHVPCGIACVD